MLGFTVFFFERREACRICRHLVEAQRIALTVIVWDRFSMRDNLVPFEAVLVPAQSRETQVHVQVQLYDGLMTVELAITMNG